MEQPTEEQPLSPIGEAIERLKVHPYGNLQERFKEWLERDTERLIVWREADNR